MDKYIVFKNDSKTGETKFLITTQEKENNKFVKQWSNSIHDAHVFISLGMAQQFSIKKNANVGSEIQFPELKTGIENLSVNISVDSTEFKNRLNKIIEESIRTQLKTDKPIVNLSEPEQNEIFDFIEDFKNRESEKLIIKHAKKVFAWIKSRFGKKN